MKKARQRRGIWIRLENSRVRFELNRKQGLLVRQRGKKQRVISFADLYDVAIGQPRLPLA